MAAPLVLLSEEFAFANQGDFSRVAGFLIWAEHWTYRHAWPFQPEEKLPQLLNANGWLLAAIGWMQRRLASEFHIAVLSLAFKLMLVGGLALLAHALFPARRRARAMLWDARRSCTRLIPMPAAGFPARTRQGVEVLSAIPHSSSH
jgi:hypothetical protein